MHILFVTTADTEYGTAYSLRSLVNELHKLNPDIQISIIFQKEATDIASFNDEWTNVFAIPYGNIQCFRGTQRWKRPLRFFIQGVKYYYGRLFALNALEKHIDLSTIDIIHTNSSTIDFGAQIAKKYKIPHVWHIREFGDLDFNLFSFNPRIAHYINMNSTLIIAISDAIKESWIKKGISEGKIIRIYNGIAKLDNNKRSDILCSDIIKFVLLGSVRYAKGHDIVIDALSLLTSDEKSRIHIDFVGGGESTIYARELKKKIEKNDLEEIVSFLGYIQNAEKYLYRYDCGLMCSRSEGFGRATVEYMMNGCLVIGSNSGATPEILDYGRCGLLFEQNNPYDLANKIRCVMRDIDGMRLLANRGKTFANSHFRASRNAECIYSIYEKLI